MIEVEHTITIGKPVEAVFDYCCDPEKGPDWQEDIVSVKADDLPLKEGSRYTETRKFMGRDMNTTLEVTAMERPNRFAMKAIDGPVPYELEVTLEAEGQSTKMRTAIQGEPGGFFKLAAGMVAKQLKESLTKDNEKLKTILETG